MYNDVSNFEIPYEIRRPAVSIVVPSVDLSHSIRQSGRLTKKPSRYLFTVDSSTTLPTPASVGPSVVSTVYTPSSDTY